MQRRKNTWKPFDADLKNARNRNVFVDANVIHDYLFNRKFHTANASDLLEHAHQYSITMYVCSYTFAIVYYRMRNKENIPHQIALGMLDKVYRLVKCLPVDGSIIGQAMKSGFKDFEDAIQYGSALQIPRCEAIITRDAKDFAESAIPVVTPRVFLLRHLSKS